MSSYRFCRTDDIDLLVDALNRCWRPYFPNEPEMTAARFKREIRDLQIWCSSCMVAFAGSDAIGVLTGAKRAGATLVHRIAVHPDHRRQGHGRHLLTSLSSKLSILGPPHIVAEVPAASGPVHGLFAACGFARDGCYTDFVLDAPVDAAALPQVVPGTFVIPVTVDDLEANGLLDAADPHVCWERSLESIRARKGEVAGLAIATEERIEAYLLYIDERTAGSLSPGTEVLALRSAVVDDEGMRQRALLGCLVAQRGWPARVCKVHPGEVPPTILTDLGFRGTETHARYVAAARAA